jgi:hypothetical protein
VVVAGEWGRGDDVERFWKGIGGQEMNGERRRRQHQIFAKICFRSFPLPSSSPKKERCSYVVWSSKK